MKPKRTILCVDDNEQSLSIRKVMLETRGYRVLAYSDAQQAIERFAQGRLKSRDVRPEVFAPGTIHERGIHGAGNIDIRKRPRGRPFGTNWFAACSHVRPFAAAGAVSHDGAGAAPPL